MLLAGNYFSGPFADIDHKALFQMEAYIQVIKK